MDVVDKYLQLMPDEALKECFDTAKAGLEVAEVGTVPHAQSSQAVSLFSKEIERRAKAK